MSNLVKKDMHVVQHVSVGPIKTIYLGGIMLLNNYVPCKEMLK